MNDFTCHLIPASAEEQWSQELAALDSQPLFGAAYHRLSATLWGGEAFLAVVKHSPHTLAWPYLLHKIHEFPGYYDINSALGFGGPLSSSGGADSQTFLDEAFSLLARRWREAGVVSLFARFSPFLSNHRLWQQWIGANPEMRGDLLELGHIVVMDVDPHSPDATLDFRKSLLAEIRKARQRGFTVVHDSDWARLDDFVAIYRGVGERNHFSARHEMTREQIAAFREALGPNAVLFHTLDGPRVAASVLGIVSGGVLHGFFGGPHPDYVRLGAYKLALHFMAEWAARQGLKQVNIGGGRGGSDADSLYAFKTAFSHNRMPFYVGRLVVNVEAYDALSAAAGTHGTEFFPAYRFTK